MDASELHVVACVANPVRWESRMRLYDDFERHMLDSGVQLTVVECAYGERPHQLAGRAHVNHVPVRATTMVWNKENLLNLGIARLPPGWRYVATIDADVHFRKLGWAVETLHALQHYHVIQPWTDCYDLGPDDEHLELHRSLLRLFFDGSPILQGPKCGGNSGYQFGHPGYAWAWKRAALEWVGGLIDTAALGAADHHMGMGLIGRVDESIHNGVTEAYRRPLRLWQDRAMHHIAKNVGYLPGTIEHRWHGSKASRSYVDRWDILVRHGFDPNVDLKRNVFGVVELSSNKPQMRLEMDRYFRQRNEDATTM